MSQIDAVRQRILSTASDIRTLLVADLGGYPDRELQRRFLAAPEVAETIDDGQLKALRQAASKLGADTAERVDTALAEPTLWFALADAGPVEVSKDLREVPAVWAEVSAVDAALQALAEGVGLGDDQRDPPGYAPPRRFIGGLYLPGLVETYTKAAGELADLLAAAEVDRREARKRSLAERWAAAAADE